MLEYELKKQLDNAQQQIELYKQLVDAYKADLINKDELIAAQDRLIELYKTKDAVTKNFDTAIIPFVIPPWPYGRF